MRFHRWTRKTIETLYPEVRPCMNGNESRNSTYYVLRLVLGIQDN